MKPTPRQEMLELGRMTWPRPLRRFGESPQMWNARRILYWFNSFVPLDLVRWREFEFFYEALQTVPQATGVMLDLSSPKLFPLFAARRFPALRIYSCDIVRSETEFIQQGRAAAECENVTVFRGDGRTLPMPPDSVDIITSISVLEHVAPAQGGDAVVLSEISRVLKPGGVALLTVPIWTKSFVEYKRGPVYERAAEGDDTFFQRVYSWPQIQSLVASVDGLDVERASSISERVFMPTGGPYRVARALTGALWKRALLGLFYPVLARAMLAYPRNIETTNRPYIGCVVLRKR